MRNQVLDGIRFTVAGDAEPALLFAHGFSCSAADWGNQFAALSERYRCVALDLPGHGESAVVPAPIIPGLAAAINRVKAHLGLRQLILIGHSLGTKVVREALRQFREGVIGVVFVDGSMNIGNAEQQRAKARAAIRKDGFADFAAAHFREMFVATSDPALVASVAAGAAGAIDPAFAEALYVEASGWDSDHGLDQLRQVGVPTLVLQSSYYNIDLKRVPLTPDITTPLMAAVQAEIKDHEIKVIEGVGHFTMLEAPEAVSAVIDAFAKRLTGRWASLQGENVQAPRLSSK